MLTPILEKLILKGQAVQRTHNVGGGASSVLKVKKDRTVIITKIIHFPFLPIGDYDPNALVNPVTQLSVFSDKSYNNFVFRNALNNALSDAGGAFRNFPSFGAPTYVDTYLVHTSDVCFNFVRGTNLSPDLVAIKPTNAQAKKPFLGYGRDGLPSAVGAFFVGQRLRVGLNSEFKPLGEITPANPARDNSYNQVQFSTDASTRIQQSSLNNQFNYPLAIVQYVEIQGELDNLISNI